MVEHTELSDAIRADLLDLGHNTLGTFEDMLARLEESLALLKKIDPEDGILIGELTVIFVIAAGMATEEISHGSPIHKGIVAIVERLRG